MSWLFSRALVAEFSAGISWDGAALEPWSVKRIHVGFSARDRMTECSLLSRFGAMCGLSRSATTPRGVSSAGCEASRMTSSSREASPARTSAQRERVRGSRVSEADCGRSFAGSFARFDRAACSWKTHQFSLLGDLELFSETWPRWGMMRSGVSWVRKTPSGLLELRSLITSEGASGSVQRFPTICAADGERGGRGDLLQMVRGDVNKHFKRLPTLVKTQRGDCPSERRRNTPGLVSAVKALPERLMTPTKQDAHGRSYHNQRDGSRRLSLLGQVVGTEKECCIRLTTPTYQDASNNGAPSQMVRNSQPLNAQVGGVLNPLWVEWLMGWPIGWTGLQPLEMDRFQEWCASHGRFCGGGLSAVVDD